MIPEKDCKRFWSKVDRRGPDECWEWTAATNNGRYPVFFLDGKSESGTRVAWAITRGIWPPDDMVIYHLCDNSLCINPEHLALVARGKNPMRMRHIPRGEASSNATLTSAQVCFARWMKAHTDITNGELAAVFGVHYQTVSKAVKNITWRHL